jgi:hypothetical protein
MLTIVLDSYFVKVCWGIGGGKRIAVDIGIFLTSMLGEKLKGV